MKKTIILIGVLILLKILLPIKPYIELNHLKIIEDITVDCKKEYTITYQEKIPKKEDNGIEYQKKEYVMHYDSLKEAKKSLKEKKNFYIKKAKIKTVSCKKKDF